MAYLIRGFKRLNLFLIDFERTKVLHTPHKRNNKRRNKVPILEAIKYTEGLQFYLKDILELISKIEKYTKEIGFEEFLKNELIQDAVVRNLEIIGEAVKIFHWK